MAKQFAKYFLISSLFFIKFANGLIDADLLDSLIFQDSADVLVNFHDGNSPAIQEISSQTFPDRVSKIKALRSSLISLRDLTQAPLLNFLNSLGVIKVHSFWSSNQLVIKNANLLLLEAVDAFSQVSRVQKLPEIKLNPLKSSAGSITVNGGVQWGVGKIEADRAWAEFNTTGQGIVVANIDTGIRGTHEALSLNFRSDHGWYDPYTNTPTPTDENGHGTHTMGTICGQNGTGVAPGAQWIACRGCNSDKCGGTELLKCGQWMLCPTNPDGSDPDPSKTPDVCSNSWGSLTGMDDWFNPTIEVWKLAGIHHAFAIGNTGPACLSTGSPGDQELILSVGSTDSNDHLSSFSSKGPAGLLELIKPNVCAPGSDVHSTWHSGDNEYHTISGTSMATPHVAGEIALVLSAFKLKNHDLHNLTHDFVTAHITETTDTKDLKLKVTNLDCDLLFYGTPATSRFPNNVFGAGRINAFKAVQAVHFGLPKKSGDGGGNGTGSGGKGNNLKENAMCINILGITRLCI